MVFQETLGIPHLNPLPFKKAEEVLFSGFVIPTEVEESLTVVWPLFDQKHLEMSRLRST